MGPVLALVEQAKPAVDAAAAVNWVAVTLVLSFSGTAGGLAFHLVKGEGRLSFPSMIVKPPNTVSLGVFADIIVGIVAANAIHVGISGIVRYDVEDTKFYTTFIALGVLAGFGGATLLKALSEKLRETVSKSDFNNLQTQVNEETERRDLLETGRLERVMEDALLYRRQPKESDNALLAIKSEEIDSKDEKDRTSVELLILAYKATGEGEWADAIELVESALKKGLPVSWHWPAHNLLGLAYHYADSDFPDWFNHVTNHYSKALDSLATSGQPLGTVRNQQAVTKTNWAFASLDAGDLKRCTELCQEVLALEPYFAGGVPVILDVARLALACASARQGRTDEAVQALKDINEPESVRYLFNDGSVSAESLKALKALPQLPAGYQFI